ncbi:hypothetical protein EJB05_56579, partial [Eragrostis curvula]
MHRAAEVTGSVIFEDSQAPSVSLTSSKGERAKAGNSRYIVFLSSISKDEDSVEEGWAYPSLCNWYKDEDSDEEGRVSLSCYNWYKDRGSDEEGWVSPSRFNWYKD